MAWLNYHHLLYFWTVAREGSVTRASAELRLAQPTISTQIRALEASLGEKLFTRAGRGLALTEAGRDVYRYADEIFALGRELQDAVRQRGTDRPLRFSVGIADVLPKLVVHRLLEPARGLASPIHFVCREGKAEPLLAELALHKLDLVLVDTPVGAQTSIKAFHHLLGECGVTFFAAPAVAARHRKRFPASLAGAPLLLPTEGTVLRRSLAHWLEAHGVQPQVAGEFEDSALIKAFGQAGAGIFAAPSVIEREVRRQYGVQVVGRTDEIRERFYAVSHERRLRHPAVVAVCEAARAELFG